MVSQGEVSGHIQALVNPPGNPRANYFVNEELPPAHEAWLEGAEHCSGTWWEDWAVWLQACSGRKINARKTLGRKGGHEPMEAAPGHIMVPGRLSVILRMASPLRYISPDYMQSIAGTIYGGSLRTNKPGARQHAERMQPPSTLGYYYQVLSLFGWSSLPWLHKLQQPTLVMAGDDDPIVRLVNSRVLAACIPHARLRVADCGHLFLLTRAAILAPEIEDFLA